jgi:F-type H+-transporting ATPase subunit delta
MKSIILDKRYAKALFVTAIETGQLEAVRNDMQLVAEVMSENKELRKMMTNPLIISTKKRQVLQQVFGKHLSEITLVFFGILIRKRREKEIPGIAQQFHRLWLEHQNIVEAEVVSAVALDEVMSRRIITAVAGFVDKKVMLTTTINPDIVGGFKVRIDDYQFDATIKSILKRMHREYDKNLFIKEF